MRLIDLDEFAELSRRWVPNLSSVEKATNENDIWDLGYLECLKVIDTCHVYKNVIPIEWIEEYRQNREDYADEYNAKAVLKRLLETWEKENADL